MVLMLPCECSAASPQTDSTRKGFEILCRPPPHVSTLCLPDDKHLTISPRLTGGGDRMRNMFKVIGTMKELHLTTQTVTTISPCHTFSLLVGLPSIFM